MRLSDYRGKPLLVSFIYTGCFQVCPAQTRALYEAVKGLDRMLGEHQFNVVSIGFNQPFDSPDAMRSFARQHRIEHRNWEFLSPPRDSVDALTRAFGFSFVATPAGFDHVLGVTVVDADGRIHAQVYGDRLRADQLGAPLRELLLNAPPAATVHAGGDGRARAHPVHRLRPRHRRVPLRLEAHLRNHRRRAVLQQRGAVFPVRMARPTACTQVLMQRPSASFRQHGLKAWRAIEGGFDTAFGSALNPLRHLGAIGFLAFWLLAASGVVLFIFFDTSVAGAWRSIEELSRLPLGLGRLLRGLHRYAADVLVLAMGLHLLREWLHGHERGFRRFHWLTGVPLIGFVFVGAIGGFWINWDELGQFSAIASLEWFDALPDDGRTAGAQFPRRSSR